jgi:hypothetical protein
LTIGTPITVPPSCPGWIAFTTRRTISTPLSSSPWMAAVKHNTGPGRVPCTTVIGLITSPPAKLMLAFHSSLALAPGKTSLSRILKVGTSGGPMKAFDPGSPEATSAGGPTLSTGQGGIVSGSGTGAASTGAAAGAGAGFGFGSTTGSLGGGGCMSGGKSWANAAVAVSANASQAADRQRHRCAPLPPGLIRSVPVAALSTQAMHFQRLRLRPESQGPRLLVQQGGHAFVFKLHGRVATVADQERHRMLQPGLVAAHEGIDRFQFVDEAVFEQEIERAVHGGRCRRPLVVAQVVEQVVGLDRLVGFGHEAQNLLAQRRQPEAALLADLGHLAQQGPGFMHVMVRMRTGLVSGVAVRFHRAGS